MASPPTANVHDAFVKEALGDAATAAVFLRERLPQEVAALLKPSAPELMAGTFVDEAYRQHHSDLLFKVALQPEGADGAGHAYIYVLIEHKSAPEALTSLQLLRYMLRVWESVLRAGHPQARPLPIVVPLVLFHGLRPWPHATSLAQLFGRVPEPLRRYLPDFEHALADLGRIADHDLSGEGRLRALLKALKYILSPRLPSLLEVVLAELWQLDVVDRRRILRYIERGSRLVVTERIYLAIERLAPEPKEITVPGFIDEIETRGAVKGKAQTLRRLLERRFGDLPESFAERIGKADEALLDRWLDRVIDAPDVASVFERAKRG